MIPVYEIATRISLQGNIQAVLAVLAKDVLQLEGGVKNLAKAFEGMGRAATLMGGALGIAGGVGAVALVVKLADKGKELLNQQEQLTRVGATLNDVNRMTGDYYSRVARAVPTAEVSEYLKTIRELISVTEDPNKAAALAPRAMQINALLNNSLGKNAGDSFYTMLRSGEMKGIATNQAKLDEFMSAAVPIMMGFGGKLTPQDYQTFARRGGAAWINSDLGKSLLPMSVLMSDLGGSQSGTAIMTAYNMMMGAQTLSKQQFEAMKTAGLVDLSKVTMTGFGGGRAQLGTGAILGSIEHKGDLPGWIRDVVAPRVLSAAHGDRDEYASLMAKIFPNRNAQKLAFMFSDEGFLDQIMKDMNVSGRIAKTPIGEHYQNFVNKNPVGVEQAFHSQFQSMLASIGAPMMQAAIPVMQQMTSLFTSIGEFANKNPGVFAILGQGLAILGAALIGGGGVAILAALGPVGWIAAGIVGLGGVLVIWKDKIQEGVLAFSEAIQKLGSVIWKSLRTLGGLLPDPTSFSGGGIGGGGLYHRASLGGGLGGGGGGIGALGAGRRGEYTDSINKLGGADAASLNAIYRTEGFSGYVGDHGTSFGPFQLHRGGPGSAGYMFEHSTGLNLADSSTVPAQIEFMRKWGRQHGGWASNVWHGLRDRGVGSLRAPGPYRSSGHSGGGGSGGATHIENVIHLDGQVVHRSVVRRIVAAAEHVRSAPYHDGSRMWGGPDMNLVPV